MAKKVLLSALFILTLWGSTPAAFAECTYDTSTDTQEHFSVFEILTVDECDELGGTTALPEEIRENAEGENGVGSVAAALILRAINILLLLIGTFAFLTIFYSGILLVTANGDESKLDRGKNILTQSILGVVIAFLSYYLVTFVQSFFY